MNTLLTLLCVAVFGAAVGLCVTITIALRYPDEGGNTHNNTSYSYPPYTQKGSSDYYCILNSRVSGDYEINRITGDIRKRNTMSQYDQGL